jgi:hypothetical protein
MHNIINISPCPSSPTVVPADRPVNIVDNGDIVVGLCAVCVVFCYVRDSNVLAIIRRADLGRCLNIGVLYIFGKLRHRRSQTTLNIAEIFKLGEVIH